MLINTALLCLSLNLYHEARSEDTASQIAVAEVTLNRVASPHYPNSVCGVVKQYKQFSWYWDEKSDKPYEKEAFKKSISIAERMLAERDHYSVVGKKATHYHASYVKPYWSKKLKKLKTVGKHIFYESN